MMQAVKGDGITPEGKSHRILDNNGMSDDGIVEAPGLVKAPDNTYMRYSLARDVISKDLLFHCHLCFGNQPGGPSAQTPIV